MAIFYDDQADPEPFLEERGLTLPVLLEGEQIGRAFGLDITGVPTTFLVGPEGEILDVIVGVGPAGLERRVRTAVEGALEKMGR